jgi:uncharacterized protein (TIGR03437 family)
VLSAPLLAQSPFIAYRGIVNAASLTPPGLPQAGIARGSIFTIFGSNLGPQTPAQVSEFPLSPAFQSVTVSVSQGGVSVSAIPIFVSSNQLNVILPSGTPLGPSQVRVGYNGRLGNFVQIEVVENAPGLFAASSGGYGPGVVQNVLTSATRPINTLDTAAVRGQVVTIYATGLGRVPFADNVAPAPTPIEAPVSVRIGEREATVLYAGRSPCCAGLDQIDVRIPDDAPAGCYVPVRVKAGNGVSNTVTMAISPSPSAGPSVACADAFNPFTNLMRSSRRQGLIHLTRTNAIIDTYNAGVEQNTTDAIRAAFLNRPASPFLFDPYFSFPAPGTCLLQQTNGNVFKGAPLRGAAPPSQALDAGPSIRLTTSSNGNADVPRVAAPQPGYAELVGSQRAADGTNGLKFEFFNTTRLEGSAGTAVGAFSAGINSTNLFNWTERPTIDRVSRSFPFRAFFTPNDSTAPTVLNLVSFSAQQNASLALTCVAAPLTQNFAVPVDLLAHFPPSPARYDGSFSMLGMGVVPLERAVPFSAPGLDGGLAVFSQWLTKAVYIQ